MLRGERHHAAEVVGRIREPGRDTGPRRIGPAGERAGEVLDGVLVVGRDRRAGRVEPARTVGVELALADSEELQQLARVVLVRLDIPRRVRLRVVHHVEELTHGGAERDLVHDFAEVREREVHQQLLVETDPAHRLELGAGDHQDLRQRERDPLPKLVRRRHRVLEESPLQRMHRVVLAVADVRVRSRGVGAALARVGVDVGEGAVAAHRLGELLLERERGALLHHFLDRGLGRPEARLLEEPHRVGGSRGLRRRACSRGRGRRRRCGGRDARRRGIGCRGPGRRGGRGGRCGRGGPARGGPGAAATAAAETAGKAAREGERDDGLPDRYSGARRGVHTMLLSVDGRLAAGRDRGRRRIKHGKCACAATARAGPGPEAGRFRV